MRKALVAFVIMSLSMFASILPAEELEPVKLQKFHGFEFGLLYYLFDYKEDLPPGLKSTEKGWVPGLYSGYSYGKQNDVRTEVFVELSGGDVDYDGTTQEGTPIKFSDNPQLFFRFEWDVGYTFNAGKAFWLAPYTGYGYRYWERGEAKITSTYLSYREEYTWHYIPLGVKAGFQVDNRWTIGGDVGARFMFGGKMTAYFSEVPSALSDLTFHLGNKAGWFAEMPIRYKFSKDWSLVGTPWYEYSRIGKSNKVGDRRAYEPASTTKQYGIKIGMNFSF